MTVLRLTAMPLTPIHIGSGETLSPEDYLLHDRQLIRFNRSAVLRDMRPEVRLRLERALDGNQFEHAQTIIRDACDHRRHALGCIEVSDESYEALRVLVAHPDSPIRGREVHPFVRNPHTGQPFIPGSSLKGAIRTAIINHFTKEHLGGIATEVANAEERRKGQTLETAALNFEFSKIEADPLRLLHVADVALPDGSTRIDRVLHVQRGKPPSDIQMHFERLLSVGDGQPVTFTVELALNERAMENDHIQRLMGRTLSFDLIRKACNRFYTGRLLSEHQRFFSDDAVPEARYGAQGLVKLQPDNILIAKSLREQGLLLRIGRFSHFESLSVDELREGWNIQKRQPIEEGSTRSLCRRAGSGGGSPMPFGWLLLKPAD